MGPGTAIVLGVLLTSSSGTMRNFTFGGSDAIPQATDCAVRAAAWAYGKSLAPKKAGFVSIRPPESAPLAGPTPVGLQLADSLARSHCCAAVLSLPPEPPRRRHCSTPFKSVYPFPPSAAILTRIPTHSFRRTPSRTHHYHPQPAPCVEPPPPLPVIIIVQLRTAPHEAAKALTAV